MDGPGAGTEFEQKVKKRESVSQQNRRAKDGQVDRRGTNGRTGEGSKAVKGKYGMGWVGIQPGRKEVMMSRRTKKKDEARGAGTMTLHKTATV